MITQTPELQAKLNYYVGTTVNLDDTSTNPYGWFAITENDARGLSTIGIELEKPATGFELDVPFVNIDRNSVKTNFTPNVALRINRKNQTIQDRFGGVLKRKHGNNGERFSLYDASQIDGNNNVKGFQQAAFDLDRMIEHSGICLQGGLLGKMDDADPLGKCSVNGYVGGIDQSGKAAYLFVAGHYQPAILLTQEAKSGKHSAGRVCFSYDIPADHASGELLLVFGKQPSLIKMAWQREYIASSALRMWGSQTGNIDNPLRSVPTFYRQRLDSIDHVGYVLQVRGDKEKKQWMGRLNAAAKVKIGDAMLGTIGLGSGCVFTPKVKLIPLTPEFQLELPFVNIDFSATMSPSNLRTTNLGAYVAGSF